jgi:hypothetical protein
MIRANWLLSLVAALRGDIAVDALSRRFNGLARLWAPPLIACLASTTLLTVIPTISLAAALSILEPLWNGRDQVLTVALWIVAVGAAATALRRSIRIARLLQG